MDDLTNWVPALTSTSLFALALWLARGLISARLTNAVKHEYDARLATVESELRRGEGQLSSVRQVALNNLAQGQRVLTEKKVTAAETIWGGILEMEKLSFAIHVLAELKLEAIEKNLDDPKIADFVD